MVRITVFRNPDLATETRVTDHGTIFFPMIGEFFRGEAIIEQDREIAEKSGQIPLSIKSIRRAGAKMPEKEWKRRMIS